MVKINLSDEQKNIFLEGMAEMEKIGNVRNPFVRMAEVLFKFNSRQLCHYWRNYLDPRVYKGNLDDEEKQFIDNWISLNRTEKGGIDWKILRQVLHDEFGRFRSDNIMKNYYYSKNRRNYSRTSKERHMVAEAYDVIPTSSVSTNTSKPSQNLLISPPPTSFLRTLPPISSIFKNHFQDY